MEAGDAEALALWKEFRDLSIIEYKKIYGTATIVSLPFVFVHLLNSFILFVVGKSFMLAAARLNVSFDIFSGESQVGGGMEAAFAIMKDKNLLSLSKVRFLLRFA
jgi:arginyl-tRNA synthetase